MTTAPGYAAKRFLSLLTVLKLERFVPEREMVQIDFHYYDVCHSDIHQVDNDCGKTVAARDYLPGFAPKLNHKRWL